VSVEVIEAVRNLAVNLFYDIDHDFNRWGNIRQKPCGEPGHFVHFDGAISATDL
jgi:hypothetical protein